MVGDRRHAGHGVGVQVGRRAHLQRDAAVAHVGGEPAEHRVRRVGQVDVVDDAHAVAEPVGAAALDGLPDRRQPECLAGVDGEVRVLAAQVLERLEVQDRREAVLGAGDVEAGHAAVAVLDDQLGDLQPALRVPHRGEQLADDDRVCPARPRAHAPRRCPPARPRRLAQRQPGGQVLLGRPAQLGVDAAVGGEVEHRLPGHAGEVLRSLHDGDRVHERLEVALERSGATTPPRTTHPARRHRRPAARGRSRRRSRRPWRRARRRRGARAARPWGPRRPVRSGGSLGQRRHPASMSSVTVSATQAGLSAPLISMVC